MRFEASQNLSQSQQMRLSARMIQSMDILQMPLMALQERIEQELAENIALELVEGDPDAPMPQAEGEAQPGAEEGEGSEGNEAGESDAEVDLLDEPVDAPAEETIEMREMVVGEESADDWTRLRDLERSYGEDIGEDRPRPNRQMEGERDPKMDAMASIADRAESLATQLQAQWRLAEVSEDLRRPGEIIIEAIDETGLLSQSLESIAEQYRNQPELNLSTELLARALWAVQQWLEPRGLAARDHRECIRLQIAQFREDEPIHALDWDLADRIVRDHFDDLVHNRLPRLAQTLEVPMERINAAVLLLRRCTIHPARDFAPADARPIFPDAVIDYDPEIDEYVARFEGDRWALLKVNDDVRQLARDRQADKPAREFAKASVDNADFLISAIEQRRHTIRRVVEAVLARQRDFFDRGPQYLKPLDMTEVADQLGVHVATVSRAVADKWLLTPRGLVPLRRFFSGGTTSAGGTEMSWEAVREVLRSIIDTEDKRDPLSDESLSAELKKRGIDIKRRTVVKYRQQLGVPAAKYRRAWGEEAGTGG